MSQPCRPSPASAARLSLRHPVAVELLNRPKGGRATIQGLTGPRSNWEMRRQPIDERYSLVELIDKTSESDVGRAHTDFVANASHELRTPLASIIGYVETLRESGETLDEATSNRFLDTILREGKRLQNLVSDLMSLSRVEAEKHDLPSRKLALKPLVERAARDAAGAERLARLELALDYDAQVRGDEQQLEQLVRNLVDNALKYGSLEEPVTVSLTRSADGLARIAVVDRGEGIAAEHIPHLTRRFYRTDPGRSRASGGTGLGLAIVKHIVERHRGRLDISSETGKGTEVIVRIPVLAEDVVSES